MSFLILLFFAFSVHTIAFIFGLFVLHKHQYVFSSRPCFFKNGLDEVEISYLSIVFSTLLYPLTTYHLFIVASKYSVFSDINEWYAAYWLALGFLLMLFHLITNMLMERVRDGLGRTFT